MPAPLGPKNAQKPPSNSFVVLNLGALCSLSLSLTLLSLPLSLFRCICCDVCEGSRQAGSLCACGTETVEKGQRNEHLALFSVSVKCGALSLSLTLPGAIYKGRREREETERDCCRVLNQMSFMMSCCGSSFAAAVVDLRLFCLLAKMLRKQHQLTVCSTHTHTYTHIP